MYTLKRDDGASQNKIKRYRKESVLQSTEICQRDFYSKYIDIFDHIIYNIENK